MFPSTPIRLSPIFKSHVVKEGLAIREAYVPQWARSSDGYKLSFGEAGEETTIIGRKHGERVLVPAKQQFELEDRRPLTNPAQFMNFARLACSEAAVLDFATEHGYLRMDPMWEQGYQRRYSAKVPASDEAGSGDEHENHFDDDCDFFGESVDEWYAHVRLMRLSIDLWTASRARTSPKEFRRLAVFHEHVLAERYVGDQWRATVENLQTPKEALATAHSIALSHINGGTFEVGLEWSFAEVLPHNRHVLEITPGNLAVGLWLQFACAMAADAHYRQCEYDRCGGFFDAESSRKSRKYCSGSCRTRAYNKRQVGTQSTRR